MFRRIFSKGPGTGSDNSRALTEAERCMTEIEALFRVASSSAVDVTDRLTALNKAARLGSQLDDFVEQQSDADPAKPVWKEQSKEVHRQLQVLTERLCPPKTDPRPPSQFDLFSGLTLEGAIEPVQQPTSVAAPLEMPEPDQRGDVGVGDSRRAPLDADMFSELIPLDTAVAPSTDKSSGLPWRQRSVSEGVSVEATFSEMSPRSLDASIGGSSFSKSRVTKKKKMQIGYARPHRKQPSVELEALVMDSAPEPTPAPVKPMVDLVQPDVTPEESLMEKASRLQKEADELMQQLDAQESPSGEPLRLLYQIQAQWKSEGIAEMDGVDNVPCVPEVDFMAALHQEHIIMKEQVERLSKTTEALSEIRTQRQREHSVETERLEQEEKTFGERLDETQAELSVLKEATESRGAEYEASRAEAENRFHELRSEKETQLTAQLRQRDALQEDIEELRARLKEKETALESVEAALSDLNSELEALNEDIPNGLDLEEDDQKLRLLEKDVAEAVEEIEKMRAQRAAFVESSRTEGASLDGSLYRLKEARVALEQRSHVLDVLELRFPEVEEALAEAETQLTAFRAAQSTRDRRKRELDASRSTLDAEMAETSSEIQSKEDTLRQILDAKRAALENKEYGEAAQLAEQIKSVTYDLSELEARRLASCQEAETLESELRELTTTDSANDDAFIAAQRSIDVCRYRRLFLLRRVLQRFSPGDAHLADLDEAIAALETESGLDGAALCTDLVEGL